MTLKIIIYFARKNRSIIVIGRLGQSKFKQIPLEV